MTFAYNPTCLYSGLRRNGGHGPLPHPEGGFTLIEVVASLVIVGIISVFSSLFLVVGLEGYEQTQKGADAAMDAEVALQRISLELRTISTIPLVPVNNSSLAYTSSDSTLPGDRAIKFYGGNLYLTAGGYDRLLIKDVSNPILNIDYFPSDLDGDLLNYVEVARINVGFTLSGMPAFKVRIYPRSMINKWWP